MLKGQSCTIQTAERSRVLFQNGVGFDIEVALKLVPPTGIFHRHTHTHTDTLPSTKWYICRTQFRCARGQFCAIYSGLLHAVRKHLSSLPYPLLLARLENECFLW